MQNIILSTLLKPLPRKNLVANKRNHKKVSLYQLLTDFSLLRNWTFVFVCIASIFFQFHSAVMGNHVVSKAYYDLGDLQKASFMGTATGIGNVVARILAMFVADRQCVSRPLYWTSGIILCNTTSFLYGFAATFPLMAGACFISGVGFGKLRRVPISEL